MRRKRRRRSQSLSLNHSQSLSLSLSLGLRRPSHLGHHRRPFQLGPLLLGGPGHGLGDGLRVDLHVLCLLASVPVFFFGRSAKSLVGFGLGFLDLLLDRRKEDGLLGGQGLFCRSRGVLADPERGRVRRLWLRLGGARVCGGIGNNILDYARAVSRRGRHDGEEPRVMIKLVVLVIVMEEGVICVLRRGSSSSGSRSDGDVPLSGGERGRVGGGGKRRMAGKEDVLAALPLRRSRDDFSRGSFSLGLGT
mmetsp:Transcript_27184/g.50348  ORF Transcript_27184/g.50348 Transcript_27184/m.50348 type:complete len:249 (-) Transcript_27184:784-1530(-)